MGELLTHLLPQFEPQGWQLLHREDGPPSLTVYRTAQGIGTLRLQPGESAITAQIVHVTGEDGPRSTRIVAAP